MEPGRARRRQHRAAGAAAEEARRDLEGKQLSREQRRQLPRHERLAVEEQTRGAARDLSEGSGGRAVAPSASHTVLHTVGPPQPPPPLRAGREGASAGKVKATKDKTRVGKDAGERAGIPPA